MDYNNQNNNNNNYYQYQQNQNFNGTYYQPPNTNQYQTSYNNQGLAYLKRKKDIENLIISGLVIGTMIVVYLVVQVIAVSMLNTLGLYDLYSNSSLFQNCFNIVAVHIFAVTIPFGLAALILRKNFVSPLIPAKKVGIKKAFLWVCLGMGGCLIANYVTSFVTAIFNAFGYELTQSESLGIDSPLACIALVFSTAIVPAVCEEFAMRCCTLGALRKYGKGFSVFAVSVVFGLLHGNVIQFVFAFLVGLVLGYVTVRTDNVIIAMFIHGFNNGLSVLRSILEYTISDDFATKVITAIFLMWLILSILSLIYLTVKKELLPPKTQKAPKEPYALSFGTKLLCLLPGFFVPFVLLIYLTSTSIVPVS